MRITIKNFLNIKHIDLNLNNITLIYGENNTGKSKILQLLYATLASNLKGTNNIERQANFQTYINQICDMDKVINTKGLETSGQLLIKKAIPIFNIQWNSNSISLYKPPTNSRLLNLTKALYINTNDVIKYNKFISIHPDFFNFYDVELYYTLTKNFSRLISLEERDKILDGIKIDIINNKSFEPIIEANKLIYDGNTYTLSKVADTLQYISIFYILINNNFFDNKTMIFIDNIEQYLSPKNELKILNLLYTIYLIFKTKIVFTTNSMIVYKSIMDFFHQHKMEKEITAYRLFNNDGFIDIEQTKNKTMKV